MDTVILGIVIKAIGQDNEIRRVKISKNDLILIDSMVHKQPVFFDFTIILDTYDTTLYSFFANDLSYNYKEFFITTLSYIDTTFDYDTIFDTVVLDSIISIDSTQIIDTLININL